MEVPSPYTKQCNAIQFDTIQYNIIYIQYMHCIICSLWCANVGTGTGVYVQGTGVTIQPLRDSPVRTTRRPIHSSTCFGIDGNDGEPSERGRRRRPFGGIIGGHEGDARRLAVSARRRIGTCRVLGRVVGQWLAQ